MNKVEKLFKDKAVIQHGGWAIYTKRDAIDFISACKKENIGILGIDGFFRGKDISHPSIPNLLVTPDSIQPSMIDSIDFTTAPLKDTVQDVYSFSIDFLNKRNDRLFFEIVCSEANSG